VTCSSTCSFFNQPQLRTMAPLTHLLTQPLMTISIRLVASRLISAKAAEVLLCHFQLLSVCQFSRRCASSLKSLFNGNRKKASICRQLIELLAATLIVADLHWDCLLLLLLLLLSPLSLQNRCEGVMLPNYRYATC
jgi:hypothetical protein